ncbi:transposase [Thorsellia anophelis]|uniref:transposase n=1 Tax=Thorsellia anophelis TaxID=336804 RepID=UPI000B87FB2F
MKLEPLEEQVLTLRKYFDGIVRGLLDNSSNAYVEAINGPLQQVKRTTKGYRNTTTL